MIARLCSAIVGLLVFAGMILVGLAAGNPFVTILQRALVGLAGGMVAGYIAGCIAENIVKEHFSDIVEAEATGEAQQTAGEAADMPDLEIEAGEGETDDVQNKEDRQNSRESMNTAQDRTLAARAAQVIFTEAGKPSTRADV